MTDCCLSARDGIRQSLSLNRQIMSDRIMVSQYSSESHVRWDAKGGFNIDINSNKGINKFNDQNTMPIAVDKYRSNIVKIEASGSLSQSIILWRVKSMGKILKIPKYKKDLISFGFVESGSLTIRCLSEETSVVEKFAVMLHYKDYIESESSSFYSAIAGAIETDALIKINAALTGRDDKYLPSFLPSTNIDTLGLKALLCTMQSVHEQSQITGLNNDLTFSLVKEIIGYQILSVWPTRNSIVASTAQHVQSSRLSMATDYIISNISSDLMLADVAAVAGLSVRGLQDNFRRLLGQTPFQYIINLRLTLVHQDLLAEGNRHLSIGNIAKQWGFVHISDFGRRYRMMYGCTPSETRQTSR